jgi:hypothetical protein
MTERLQDNLGLSEDVAYWAVESWALALGITSVPVKPVVGAPGYEVVARTINNAIFLGSASKTTFLGIIRVAIVGALSGFIGGAISGAMSKAIAWGSSGADWTVLLVVPLGVLGAIIGIIEGAINGAIQLAIMGFISGIVVVILPWIIDRLKDERPR